MIKNKNKDKVKNFEDKVRVLRRVLFFSLSIANLSDICNSAVLVTMIYGVVVKDVDYSMSMGGRYAPCQATLGLIWT